jgi:hypothetical protein
MHDPSSCEGLRLTGHPDGTYCDGYACGISFGSGMLFAIFSASAPGWWHGPFA